MSNKKKANTKWGSNVSIFLHICNCKIILFLKTAFIDSWLLTLNFNSNLIYFEFVSSHIFKVVNL